MSAGLEFDPAGDKNSKDFSLPGGWNSDGTSRTINASATLFNGAAAGACLNTGRHTTATAGQTGIASGASTWEFQRARIQAGWAP